MREFFVKQIESRQSAMMLLKVGDLKFSGDNVWVKGHPEVHGSDQALISAHIGQHQD